MKDNFNFSIIARIRTQFPSKFGIPRQSGIVTGLEGRIEFEPEFRDDTAVRGLEEFSHIWLLWKFSENADSGFSPAVRPPRLGGNKKMGVFATRSPFRPNPIGLSCVKLEGMEHVPGKGTVLLVSGADLMDGTPIYDIKPYIPYTDCVKEASGGFSDRVYGSRLKVVIPSCLTQGIDEDKLSTLKEILAEDPRPGYHNDRREYRFEFAGYNIRFTVTGDTLYVSKINKL